MPLPHQFRRLRLPVIGSPMFIVSSLDLVEAQCRAGVLGTFPALNARPQEELAVWLEQLQGRLEGTHGLYGVNLICHASNDRLAGDLAAQVPRGPRLFAAGQALGRDAVDGHCKHERGGVGERGAGLGRAVRHGL